MFELDFEFLVVNDVSLHLYDNNKLVFGHDNMDKVAPESSKKSVSHSHQFQLLHY